MISQPTSQRSGGRLLLLPSLQVGRGPRGGHVLTKKFVEGAEAYVRRWPGPVTVAIEPSTQPDGNLDHAEWLPEELGFEVVRVSFADRAAMDPLFRDSALVAAGLDHRQAHLAAWAKRAGTKIVYTSEYTLQTRFQIVDAEGGTSLQRTKRKVWAAMQEARYVRALLQADAIQCNGEPTYRLYRRLVKDSLLFFDTRTSDAMVVDDHALRAKRERALAGEPLHLAFSGRLNHMKGADLLVAVAKDLAGRGVPFSFDVFGDGPLAADMRRDSRELGEQFRMRGVLDFASELVPLVKRDIDLYVICHRQGDPSCTYLETLACGVPIVGFANEAWRGLADHGRFGWSAKMEDVPAIADRIEHLHRNRGELASAMDEARDFASSHTFERTFAKRLDHLQSVAFG